MGTEAAAGFSLATADLNRLQKSYWYAVERNWFEDVELDPHRITDAPLDLGELSFSLVDDLAKLEPFGNGNPEPVFFVAGVTVEAAQTMGKENQHLKVWVRNEQGFTYPVLAFGKGEQRHAWQAGALHHLLVTVGDHRWKGERTIQMRMVDGR